MKGKTIILISASLGRYRYVCNNVLLLPLTQLNLHFFLCHLTDVNECEVYRLDQGGKLCVHECVNVPGSYHCSCPSGYKLLTDGRSCEGEWQDETEDKGLFRALAAESGWVCRSREEYLQITQMRSFNFSAEVFFQPQTLLPLSFAPL